MIRIRRLWTVCFFSFAPFSPIVVRLAYLQVVKHGDLEARAERQVTRHQGDMTSRGAILDRTGATLSVSIQGGSCFADPKLVENPTQTAATLAQWLHVSATPIKARLVEKKRFVWLARRLDPQTIAQLKALHLPGISVQPEMRRFCPEQSLAAHTLGVTSDEQSGLSGVELTADRWLSGKKMPFLFKQWAVKPSDRTAPYDSGDWPAHSLVLTLDRTLQTIVEQELAAQMKMSRPKTGMVIVEDPQTGEILAMATAPTFNPNLWGVPNAPQSYGPDTLRNPPVEQVYEPGSTFKMVTASAALEEHKVTPSDTIFCENGQWKIAGRNIHDHEKEGWLTFTDIISYSSNIGTAKVAMRLGETNMYHYARAYGFGMSTSIGLPGDSAGILRDPRQWSASSLETISFGQEVGVTPLQMVNAYSALANGGLLLEPRLYKGYVDADEEYHEWETRRVVRRVISPKTAAVVRGILEHVVEAGTGKEAQVAGFKVAGKTGTAQKFDNVTHQYHADRYLASFCGMVPADHPRLVIGVFLDEPQASHYGGAEAAPLFARIVRNAANYLHLEPALFGPLASIPTHDRS